MTELRKTPLHALHLRLGARMVPFAGYEMPVQYRDGVSAEHKQCRSAAALFDVSHMGQIRLGGDDAAAALESLVPMDARFSSPAWRWVRPALARRWPLTTRPAGC